MIVVVKWLSLQLYRWHEFSEQNRAEVRKPKLKHRRSKENVNLKTPPINDKNQ